MRVVDSSAWIEWLIDSETGQRLTAHIPGQAECLVPTTVQLELWKWLVREKGEEEADRFLAYTMKCHIAPLDSELAVRAAECSAQLKLATADAIVYATAVHFNADILTCDAHFKDLDDVILIEKAG